MNPDSDRLHEKIMGWHKDFLQYYIKKEDAPIEFINRGIEILEEYREILQSKCSTDELLKRCGALVEANFLHTIGMCERD